MTYITAVPSSARLVAQTYIHASTTWTLIHLMLGLAAVAATVWLSVLAADNRRTGGFGLVACVPAIVGLVVLSKLARHTSTWSIVGLLVIGVLIAGAVALWAGYESTHTDQVWWYVAAGTWAFGLVSMLIEEALTRFAASIPMALGDLVRVLALVAIGAFVWLAANNAPGRSQRRSSW